MRRIIYDGDSFYELDEDCVKGKKEYGRKNGNARQEEQPRRASIQQKQPRRKIDTGNQQSASSLPQNSRRRTERKKR